MTRPRGANTPHIAHLGRLRRSAEPLLYRFSLHRRHASTCAMCPRYRTLAVLCFCGVGYLRRLFLTGLSGGSVARFPCNVADTTTDGPLAQLLTSAALVPSMRLA